MDRRNFLKGVFGGVTTAGMIVAATPQEIEAFSSPLALGAPMAVDLPATNTVEFGEHLYNARGELVAIVTSFKVQRSPVDVTMFGDYATKYLPGIPDIRIEARGVGAPSWDGLPLLGGVVHRG